MVRTIGKLATLGTDDRAGGGYRVTQLFRSGRCGARRRGRRSQRALVGWVSAAPSGSLAAMDGRETDRVGPLKGRYVTLTRRGEGPVRRVVSTSYKVS